MSGNLYLLIDLAEGPNRAAAAEDITKAFAPDIGELGWHSHTLGLYQSIPAAPGPGRSYGDAFRRFANNMRCDRAERPLLMVVTDTDPGGDWQAECEVLTASHPTVDIRVVDHRDDPAGLFRAIAADRPWEGSFTPYSVGDPGNAARKVRAVPDAAEWDRRDTVLDGVEIQGANRQALLHVRAASVRGLGHRYAGTVRQDDYAFRRTPSGRFLVAAVADGVSNSELSHKAASLITRQGCELLAGMLDTTPADRLDWPGLIEELSRRICIVAQPFMDVPDGAAVAYREVAATMAATALFGVVDLQPVDGGLPAHVFAIGDSPAWVLRDGRVWKSLHDIKNSGDGPASSITRALPGRRRDEVPQEALLRPGDVLVLMSDGIADPLQDGSGPVGRFLAESWRTPPAPLAFAGQVDFARRSHDDDRTAVAIWVP
ncbi:protein phosphatase 2C domain-containing protein [Actinoplanes sp. NPDC051470]|uniref:protein phosphatase 2C domain-containing protein n=1 Tax=Actinoplanes sp. NPDC051470 TaxID=3157224 RepID=UPI00341963C4